MTLRVWKFPFDVRDDIEIPMPAGAEVLYVGTQGQLPVLWAMCDAEAPIEPRRFRVAGTGQPIGESEVDGYVGTFMMMGGALVWHLFEKGRRGR